MQKKKTGSVDWERGYTFCPVYRYYWGECEQSPLSGDNVNLFQQHACASEVILINVLGVRLVQGELVRSKLDVL